MLDLAVRPAERADLPAVADLLGAQLDEHGVALSREGLERVIAGLLDDPRRGELLVAAMGGELVGVACISFIWTLEHGGASAWLDELYVRPEHRGGGIGAALVEAVIARARSRGQLAIDLEVEADHARVEGLYRRHGFEPHARRRWVKRLA